MKGIYVMSIFTNIDFSLFSCFTFLLVLAFLEFCVFCYFTPDLFSFIKKKKNYSYHVDDENNEEIEELIEDDNAEEKFDFPEQEWIQDEIFEEDMKPLVFPDEEWKEDDVKQTKKEAHSLLLEIDPDFKLDEFYHEVFDLYANIDECYTEDKLREVSDKMTKELYQENVKQLDYFRRNNLQHVVRVEDYVNCKILKVQVVEHNLYVKLELKVGCFDYIMSKSSQKVIRGINGQVLNCTYHLVVQKKMKPTRMSYNSITNKLSTTSIMSSSNEENNWILSENKIVRRRVR